MAFIILITIVIYILLIAWTWHSLGDIEKEKKVGIIAIGILVTYIITLTIFNFSKQAINYENPEMAGSVKNIIVMVFTGVNGLISLPFLSRILDKINGGEMEKQDFFKALLVIGVIFILCMFFEYGYMKDMQQGILQIFNSMR